MPRPIGNQLSFEFRISGFGFTILPMLLTLLILLLLVTAFWAMLLLHPAQRHSASFIYSTTSSPDALNAIIPNDDITTPYAGDPPIWPSVTIIVPGRNEGHILASTLGSLCQLDYPALRIIFIDDQSTDNTAEVCQQLLATHKNLTVIHNTQPPQDGWIGKTWAVHQAEPHMHESGGADYLLFTDSDLVFHPQCLKQMVRLALHRRTDITSLLPSLRYESIGELLGLLPAMVLINARYSLYIVNNPARKESLVAGGFLLAKRSSYEALGGHAAVRGQVIEDIALGKTAKSKGFRVFTACTHDLITARMYEGWKDTYRGLKKNAYAGANYNPLLIAPYFLFMLLAGAAIPLYAIAGIFLWITTPSLLTFTLITSALFANLFLLIAGRRAAKVLGMPQHVAWFLPAGFAFYCAVFLGSIKDFYHGGNEWSGRKIASQRVQNLSEI